MQGYCTINCDASVKNSKCAFGARIYTDEYITELYGPLNCEPDSNIAELAGVHACIKWVCQNYDTDKIDFMVINCDNNRVRDIINSRWMPVRDSEEVFRDEIYLIRNAFKKLYAKNIKGHSKSVRGRNMVNNRCDELAAKGIDETSIQVTTTPNIRNSQITNGVFQVIIKVDSETHQFEVPAPNMYQAERLIIDKLKESFKLVTYGKEKT